MKNDPLVANKTKNASDPPECTAREALDFLKILDPDRLRFELRTFSDVVMQRGGKHKRPGLTKTFTVSRAELREGAEVLARLARLNKLGAGVFVTINRTDGKGRREENVTGVQAIFADTDGAPIEPLLALRPHIVVQSSPGKWHVYWRVSDCAPDQFERVQQAVAKKFGTDPRVSDPPRVMRLPGFHHNKGEPFLTKLCPEEMSPEREPYTLEEIVAGLGLSFDEDGGSRLLEIATDQPLGLRSNVMTPSLPPPPVEEMRSMLEFLNERDFFKDRKGVTKDQFGKIVAVGWIETGMALKHAYPDDVGFDLWSITHEDEQAEDDAPQQWASFKTDAARRLVTVATIIRAAQDAGWTSPHVISPTDASERLLTKRLAGDSGDVHNGKAFTLLFRDHLVFVHETNDLLKFDAEAGWIAAPPGEAERAAKEVLAQMRAQVAERWKVAPDDSNTKRLMAHVERSSQAQRIYAMIDMAKSEPRMTVSLNDFDSDPMLLGTRNGVLDLRTGQLLRLSPDVRVSKRCNVAFSPQADCPQWKKFLEEIQPDPEMRAFLQRLVAYCLTGLTGEQVFAVLYGLGRNGKSVFIETIAYLLGDYAHKVPTELLMQHQRNPQGPSPDIVALKGRRFIYATETEDGARLAAARVKELTGGDSLTGRVPYGKDFVTFRPTHKLFIVGNHKPEIGDNSFGMWRRVLLTPFKTTVPADKCDPQLLEKLKVEAPGILNWALAGLFAWRKGGLQVPGPIRAATDAYRDENDIIGEWIAENYEVGAGGTVKKADLYIDYREWCIRNGHQPLAQGRLTRRLKERGFQLAPDKRTVLGLSLRTTFGVRPRL